MRSINSDIDIESFNFPAVLNYVCKEDAKWEVDITHMLFLETKLIGKCISQCLRQVRLAVEARKPESGTSTRIPIEDLRADTGFSRKFIARACKHQGRPEFPIIDGSQYGYIEFFNAADIKLVFKIISSNESENGILVGDVQAQTGFTESYTKYLITFLSDSMYLYYTCDIDHVKMATR